VTESLVQQLKVKRAALMVSELEDVALRLFEDRGFADVTVQEIASKAQISVRTFYRYFPAKEDVLQLRIQRGTEVIAAALENRPPNEPPLHSVRVAFEAAALAEDESYARRWISVVRVNEPVLRAVIGGIQLNSHQVIREFIATRLGLSAADLVPTMLTAAVSGVLEAAHTRWYMEGGDLPMIVSESLEVLERAMGPGALIWGASEFGLPMELNGA